MTYHQIKLIWHIIFHTVHFENLEPNFIKCYQITWHTTWSTNNKSDYDPTWSKIIRKNTLKDYIFPITQKLLTTPEKSYITATYIQHILWIHHKNSQSVQSDPRTTRVFAFHTDQHRVPYLIRSLSGWQEGGEYWTYKDGERVVYSATHR